MHSESFFLCTLCCEDKEQYCLHIHLQNEESLLLDSENLGQKIVKITVSQIDFRAFKLCATLGKGNLPLKNLGIVFSSKLWHAHFDCCIQQKLLLLLLECKTFSLISFSLSGTHRSLCQALTIQFENIRYN